MRFSLTLAGLTTLLSAASTAHTALTPRQAPTQQCSSTNSISNTTTTTTTNTTTPVALNALLTSFLTFSPSDPLPQDNHIQIRETSMLYPIIIDGKDFSKLGLLFADDVVANLSEGPVIHGLDGLTAALQASVANVDSHHNLGTQLIDYTGGCAADTVTYFHASLIGKGDDAHGRIGYALGQYQDQWVKGSMGWKIAVRNLVNMSPFIGNASIVTG